MQTRIPNVWGHGHAMTSRNFNVLNIMFIELWTPLIVPRMLSSTSWSTWFTLRSAIQSPITKRVIHFSYGFIIHRGVCYRSGQLWFQTWEVPLKCTNLERWQWARRRKWSYSWNWSNPRSMNWLWIRRTGLGTWHWKWKKAQMAIPVPKLKPRTTSGKGLQTRNRTTLRQRDENLK